MATTSPATTSPTDGPTGPASLQSVIRSLSDFWAERGCALLPPCSFEVPLGLLHPEAVFRLLDTDPWRAAFLQPISRPSDSRGGRHPFRGGRHLQFQVVWKHPRSTAPRDTFLASLEALGFDLRQHDLRLRASVLEVEAVGAHGRGWRVELDGLGLGRIHFVERLAGQALAPADGPSGPAGRCPAAVEITYGLERLAMALSDVDDVFRVSWHVSGEGRGPSSRSKRREAEEELHRYATSVANVGYLRQVMDGLDREAERCLAAGLPRAAYELAIRLLPVLDQLETRGDLAVRERRHWLAEVRRRVAAAAELYLEQYGVGEDGVGARAGVDAGAEMAAGADDSRVEDGEDGAGVTPSGEKSEPVKSKPAEEDEAEDGEATPRKVAPRKVAPRKAGPRKTRGSKQRGKQGED